ncbi:transducin wd40 repeat-like superfamily protein [Plasmopara halstedii]|uniref:Transducin wd40 repeat-like superfamily protein n=1 Tax=Plasmopara halstedii TaxID=4781 RepID=A0A0P1B2P4_PLAHL|nr:transducin wd40 repeat-like superfamily protein [Plasmopara halstedii]CEG48540.1 transducin wd40 repeat-like superfamily protein [Plasmopara halstedii]|eukprot:XP_024584909.1 transducin wd40 repeat-like superfamily protein [Plasmopara halstedii]
MEPFDASKYALWAFKMKMYLMSKGLWDTVLGEAGVTAMKEQQAHAAIVLNLKNSQLVHAMNTTSAHETWATLEGFYRTQDMASRPWLKEKFASFKYTATDMSTHVMELKQLVLQMKSANCELNEEDVCATTLRSLPASYESLVQAFSMSVSQFSFSKQKSRRIESETALHVGKQREKRQIARKSGGQRKKGANVQCYNCGKRGYYARDCWVKDSGNGDNGSQHENHSDVAFSASKGSAGDC